MKRPLTLHRQLYDAPVLAEGVDGVTGEETRVLTHGWHDLQNTQGIVGESGGWRGGYAGFQHDV